MRLLILRHGVAVDASEVGGDDTARYLTPEGRRGVRDMARAMAAWRFKPAATWTSGWVRARETAEIALKELGGANELEIQHTLEGPTDLTPLLGQLRAASALESLMLVGHNPSLEELTGLLIAGPDAKAGPAQIKLRKGGLAVIDFDSKVTPGSGTLRGLWAPNDIKALSGN